MYTQITLIIRICETAFLIRIVADIFEFQKQRFPKLFEKTNSSRIFVYGKRYKNEEGRYFLTLTISVQYFTLPLDRQLVDRL